MLYLTVTGKEFLIHLFILLIYLNVGASLLGNPYKMVWKMIQYMMQEVLLRERMFLWPSQE